MTSLHLSSTSAHSTPQWSVLHVSVVGHGTACFLDCAVSLLCSISFSRLSLLQQLACNELREMLHCSSPPKKRTLHVLRLIRAYITCLYRGPVYTKSLVPWSKGGYADASKSEKRSRGVGGWKVTVIRASRCYWSTFFEGTTQCCWEKTLEKEIMREVKEQCSTEFIWYKVYVSCSCRTYERYKISKW